MRHSSNRPKRLVSGFSPNAEYSVARPHRNAFRLGPGLQPQQDVSNLVDVSRDEIHLQTELYKSAMDVMSKARAALVEIARQSQNVRAQVSCDQEDWPDIIRDSFNDLSGDTFGCLPDAIDRAAREQIYDL